MFHTHTRALTHTHTIRHSCSRSNELGPFLKKKNFMAEGFDAYGCGQSDKPKEKEAYAEEELQEDLKAVFSKAKHPTTNFIIGHSYGTSQVIKLYNSLSSEEQRCVKGIVLLSGSLPGTNGGHPIFILPSMILDLLQGWMSSNFRKAAFHPKASEELLALAEGEGDIGVRRATKDANPIFVQLARIKTRCTCASTFTSRRNGRRSKKSRR
jgi:pimeloyl-ACP methyl ester carboxylesterase